MRERLSVVFEDLGRPGDAPLPERWHQLRVEARRLGIGVIHSAMWDRPPAAEGAPEGPGEARRCPTRGW
jgi:hypothetical protein